MTDLPSQAIQIRTIHEGKNVLGESPVWCWRTQRLYWTDIKSARIFSHDPASNDTQIHVTPEDVAAVGLHCEGGLVMVMGKAVVHYLPETGEWTTICDVERDIPGNRGNDSRVDRQGRFWIGTMSATTRDPTGALYRLDGSDLVRMRDDIIVPNCLAWSPDSTTMYFCDTWRGDVEAMDFDPSTGTYSNARPFIGGSGLRGVPDGATVDASGNLWHARHNGGCVARITAEGTLDQVIDVPASKVTAVALGGPELKTLYVTSARQRMTPEELAAEPLSGALFAIEVDIPGLPEPEFAR